MSEIRRVRRRSPEVDAFHYTTAFPLEFLRDDEHVAAAPGEPGSFVVVHDGKIKAKVHPDEWVIRAADGDLVTLTAERFLEEYEGVEAWMATAIRPRISDEFLAQNQQRRILDALADLVVDAGYRNCSVADIVSAAGIARNTFYENFGSKAAAAKVLAESVSAELGDRFKVSGPDEVGIGLLLVELAARWRREGATSSIECGREFAEVLRELAAAVDDPTDSSPSTDPHQCTLPPGRHGLSRDFIAANQRQRLLGALASCIGRQGYLRVRISDVTEDARVSRRTFYEHFDSIDAAGLKLVALSSDAGADLVDVFDPRLAAGALAVEVVAAGVVGGRSAAIAKAAETQALLAVLEGAVA